MTSLEEVDLPYIREALSTEPAPLPAAGIHPPDSVFEKFAGYFPKGISLEYMVKRLMEISKVSPLFFMCDEGHLLENSEVIDAVPSMHLIDQLTLMVAPIIARQESNRLAGISFAACVAEHTNGRLLDIEAVDLEILEQPVTGDKEYMHKLESLHKSVILYTWLSYRFGGIFIDRTLAVHVKELLEERMVRALTEFSANKKLRKDASLRRQIRLQKQMATRERFMKKMGGGEVNPNDNAKEMSLDDEESPETDIEANENEYDESAPSERRDGEAEDEYAENRTEAPGDTESTASETSRDSPDDPAAHDNPEGEPARKAAEHY